MTICSYMFNKLWTTFKDKFGSTKVKITKKYKNIQWGQESLNTPHNMENTSYQHDSKSGQT